MRPRPYLAAGSPGRRVRRSARSAARRSTRGFPALPDAARASCDRSAAILFGSVGLPEYDGKPLAQRPEYALFVLRAGYELYANLRPVRSLPGLEEASSLKPELVRGLDLIVVRELTGGIYYGRPRSSAPLKASKRRSIR